MFSVEEMCGTIRTSLYRCTNVQYSLLNWKLSPEKFGFCAAWRRVCLSLNKNCGAVSQFSIFLYVKCQVYTMYNIKIMHAFGCRQIFLCIVSSKHTTLEQLMYNAILFIKLIEKITDEC